MSRRPLLLLISLLVFIASPVLGQRERDTYTGNSQTFEVSGEVRLNETGGAITSVPVRLERFSGGLVEQIFTDNRGRFRFPNLPRGYYKVIVNAPGYRPAQQDADMQVLFRVYLVFELTADGSKSGSGLALLTDVVDARVPPSAREAFANGRVALTKKNYKKRLPNSRRPSSRIPNLSSALLLGTTFMDLREWDNAEKALLRSLEIKSDSAPALISLGEVYWRQKRER